MTLARFGWMRFVSLGCVLLSAAGLVAPGPARAQSNPIQVENELPGTPVGAVPTLPAGGAIAGYASETSALPGDTLHFHVSTSPVAPYRVEVYRLGWYGGVGARLIGCTPSCVGSSPGQQLPLPTPDANGLVQANWPVTDTFTLPPTATSGYYRIRFVLLDGRGTSSYVIVRSPPGYHSAILVQVPVNTWQAYNTWGGTSLYPVQGQAWEANRVSFDRPYYGNGLAWEYPLVLFLEREGYDVSYQTDIDTDSNPGSLLDHRLVIVAGHSEYWTHTMRVAFGAARDAGVNLAFLGANDAYWQVRYENNDRVIVGYKSTADPITDPKLETILFRALNPPEPECELIGIQHQGGSLNWASGDYSVVPSSLGNPWFAGTGFDATSVVRGVVGVETDTIPHNMSAQDSCGHQLTDFFHREMGGDTLGNADATAYTAPSGAVVFAAGSKEFAWGLADGSSLSGVGGGLVDPRLQIFVENMLNDLSATRAASLAVTLTSDRADPPGDRIKVDVAVANEGPAAVRRAMLLLSLPRGVDFVRVASQGLKCTIAPLSCELDQFATESSVDAVFTFRAQLSRPAAITAQIIAPTASNPNPSGAFTRLFLEPPMTVLVGKARRHGRTSDAVRAGRPSGAGVRNV